MQLNKVLQAENDRLRKDIEVLRTADLKWHIDWWNLRQENIGLWKIVEGMTCPYYGPGIETFEL